MRKFARVSNSSGQWKCAFCLTRDGKALKVQRTIFSECFYIMAMDELSKVTGDKDMQVYVTLGAIFFSCTICLPPLFVILC